MKRTVQVFLQLHEANKYALVKNPILRRLAVVLLDNIVELQLVRRAQTAFLYDETNWRDGVRKYDRKVRYGVAYKHARLLEFAVEMGWISQEDMFILRYAHRVRNAFYHEGRYDGLDAELAIRLLYRFICGYFPIARANHGVTQLSPYDPIPIDSAHDDSGGFSPLLLGIEGDARDGWSFSELIKSERYWKNALERILTYRPTDDIRLLIHKKVVGFIDELDANLRFLSENDTLDFNEVLIRRFARITPALAGWIEQGWRMDSRVALNIYLAALKDEERLLDIADEAERATAFHKLVNGHRFKLRPLTRQKIVGCRKRAQRILTSTEGVGISVFLRMEEDLHAVAGALQELTFDVNCYIDARVNEMLGK